jgi:hypothetical protein
MSVSAQHVDHIEADNPVRWNPGSEESQHGEDKRHAREHDRVSGAHAKEERANGSAAPERTQKARRRPDRDDAQHIANDALA